MRRLSIGIRAFWGRYKLLFYILRHPFDGFYVMKFENKGTLWVAFINFMLLWLSVSFNNQYASILVDQRYPLSLNSLRDGSSLLGFLILWSAANWSVTSLAGGEGRFKDIIMANCYALTPIILTFIPATLLSNVMTGDETAFYFMLINIGLVWFLMLAFVGMVTVHNYTAGKAFATLFLTVIAMLIIVFLIGLLIILWQQMLTFAFGIYRELQFR